MDKIKTVKIKEQDGSISEESYYISVDARNVDMDNKKQLQETVGNIDIDNDGDIATQLKNKINKVDIIDNLDSNNSNKVLSAKQGKVLRDSISNLNTNVNKKVYYFNTVADMKNANLKNGDVVQTLGYHEVNDGGGATYRITNTESQNEYQEEINNNLHATLIVENYITPEIFGAYGDGVHDDTLAWQKAVDIGIKVKAMHKIYVVNKIEVNKNINIDCNNAKFHCNDNTLFDIKGSINYTLTDESNYIAKNQNYTISNTNFNNYTGFAVITGDNNFQESRSYYVGGFVGYFKSGKLNGSYPITVTNPVIELITPIEGSLKNIGAITHANPSTSTVSINISYGYGYKIKNIKNDTSVCYKCIQLSKCLNCICDNLCITQHFDSSNNNSYIIDFDDSSFCSVLNSTLHNDLWHTITTGGTILCYSNLVQNCHMTSNTQYAYLDHENARGTTVKDSTCQCIGVAGLGTIDNVIVIANNDDYKRCMIRLSLTSEEENAIYNVTNCSLISAENTNINYCGIQMAMSSPQVSGKTYYAKMVNIDNVKSIGNMIGRVSISINSNSFGVIGNIHINNSILNFGCKVNSHTNVDISNSKCIITNCNEKFGDHYMNIGGIEYVWNEITVTNCKLWRLYGNYTTVYLDNIDFESSLTSATTAITNLYGGNLKSPIMEDCLLACTNLMISAMHKTTNDKWFNICNTSNKKYYSHISNGTMVTAEITYNN